MLESRIFENTKLYFFLLLNLYLEIQLFRGTNLLLKFIIFCFSILQIFKYVGLGRPCRDINCKNTVNFVPFSLLLYVYIRKQYFVSCFRYYLNILRILLLKKLVPCQDMNELLPSEIICMCMYQLKYISKSHNFLNKYRLFFRIKPQTNLKEIKKL